MDYNNIILETNNKISYITINRPNQLNSLNSETIKELNDAIILSEENKNIRCIILTGIGTKAFVAGADIKEFSSFNTTEGENLAREGQELVFDLIENASTPSISSLWLAIFKTKPAEYELPQIKVCFALLKKDTKPETIMFLTCKLMSGIKLMARSP